MEIPGYEIERQIATGGMPPAVSDWERHIEPDTDMRALAVALLLAAAAIPAEGQKKIKRPADRILAEELETFADASLTEVIEKARPKFFWPEQTRTDFTLATPWRVMVYKGLQVLGDSSILRQYKASEVKEIRYYRVNEAGTRFGADNASVILLTFKTPSKK